MHCACTDCSGAGTFSGRIAAPIWAAKPTSYTFMSHACPLWMKSFGSAVGRIGNGQTALESSFLRRGVCGWNGANEEFQTRHLRRYQRQRLDEACSSKLFLCDGLQLNLQLHQ